MQNLSAEEIKRVIEMVNEQKKQKELCKWHGVHMPLSALVCMYMSYNFKYIACMFMYKYVHVCVTATKDIHVRYVKVFLRPFLLWSFEKAFYSRYLITTFCSNPWLLI